MTGIAVGSAITWGMLESGLLIGIWEFGDLVFRRRWAWGSALPSAVLAPLALTWLLVLHLGPVPWAVFGVLSLGVLAVFAPLARRFQPKTWYLWTALYVIAILAVLAASGLNGDSATDAITTAVVAVFAGIYGYGQAARSDEWTQTQRRACEDGLTGALTRYGGERWLAGVGTTVGGVAIACDLDDFKWFNDTWGHAAGDAVFVETVQRLRGALRHQDAIVRNGGDEFTLWIPDIPAPQAQVLAERVHAALTGTPLSIHGHQTDVGCSMDWAVGSMTKETGELADRALLTAKRQGKNQVVGVDHSTIEDGIAPLVSARLLTAMADALWADWEDAAVLTDRDGRILTCNPAFEALTGRSRQILRYQKPGINSAGSTPQTVYDDLWERLGMCQPWRGMLLNRRPDGTTWWAYDEIWPIRFGDNVLGYWVRVRNAGAQPVAALAEPLAWDNLTVDPVFQPLIASRSGSIVGYEALIRPQVAGIPMGPDRLFAMADITGILKQVDQRALTAVAGVLEGVSWPDDWMLSLNIRGVTLMDVEWVLAYLDRLPMPRSQVIIEIAEKDGLPQPFPSWKALRSAYPDVQFAVDDWGTGQNDIARLIDLAPEWIKIDRTWLLSAQAHRHSRELLQGFVGWVHGTGARVILEGVESADDNDLADALNMDAAQGYFWGRPGPWPTADHLSTEAVQ
ncbi:MAG: hypothetical protein C7B46_14900 [Sulfobacillus benefaciens]|uniref:Diguanylate cyclase n=1 Tax=Sulfobacillus benefaciens TaxID=453960 RepID=A0A2T2XCV4_9FIRM|nr:MAG: hypothetical protein C7B46_14900 [Sulfobacillus benefaciens]